MAAQVEMTSSQFRLYGGPRTRATLVQWYLEELGISYEYILLDLSAQEHQTPDYLAINPIGKVPAAVDGEVKIWESGAILLYLADKYGKTPNSAASRAEMSQWVIFANATLGTSLFLEDRRDREAPRLLKPLNEILEKQSYLVGSDLTAADIAVGSYLFYSKVMFSFDLSGYPAVDAYVKRLVARPAFQKTMGQR